MPRTPRPRMRLLRPPCSQRTSWERGDPGVVGRGRRSSLRRPSSVLLVSAVAIFGPGRSTEVTVSTNQRWWASPATPGNSPWRTSPGKPGALFVGSGFPDPGSDKVYAIWMLQGSTAVSGGCVRPHDGSIVAFVDADLAGCRSDGRHRGAELVPLPADERAGPDQRPAGRLAAPVLVPTSLSLPRLFLARDRARTERQAAGERPGTEGSFGPERSWRHVPPARDHRPVASAVGQRNWVGGRAGRTTLGSARLSDQPAAERLANGVAGRDSWMRMRVSTTRTPSASTITGLQSISAISG